MSTANFDKMINYLKYALKPKKTSKYEFIYTK
jgi:hypothetical protein